jgi:hypothetical protein
MGFISRLNNLENGNEKLLLAKRENRMGINTQRAETQANAATGNHADDGSNRQELPGPGDWQPWAKQSGAQAGKNWCEDDMKPANANTPGPCVPPAVHEMRAGLADLRQILGMPDPELIADIVAMRVDNIETVASSGERTAIPMRNYNSEAGKGDE